MPTSPQPRRHVAGLDTAANRLHLYCDNGAHWSLVIPDRLKLDPDERRHRLYNAAQLYFGLLPEGTLICAEEPIALKNGKTTRLLGLAAGAIWAAHLRCSVFWTWVDIAHWKKEVIGNGNADKAQVKQWVEEHMLVKFDEPDFYDAAALCRYGVQRIDAGVFDHGGRT